jgi:FixJ family two-component response regulator
MSGYGDEELAAVGTGTGAVFMSKPFNISELVESAVRLCKPQQ